MQQSRPEVMPVRLPLHLWWTILKPICERHIAVREVDCVRSSLGCNRVLLRQYQAHNFAQLDVVQEELYMDGIWLILRRSIRLIVNEVVRRYHLHIRVFDIDTAWSPKSNSNGPVSREQCPPDPLPKALVRSAELRMLDTTIISCIVEARRTEKDSYLLCMPEPCATMTATLLQ